MQLVGGRTQSSQFHHPNIALSWRCKAEQKRKGCAQRRRPRDHRPYTARTLGSVCPILLTEFGLCL